MARLSEALQTLLVPHEMRDHPEAAPLVRRGASVSFENISFTYPGGREVFGGADIVLCHLGGHPRDVLLGCGGSLGGLGQLLVS